MTTCKHCNQEFDNTSIKAWGREITPVNCDKCRKLNRVINSRHVEPLSWSCNCNAPLNPGGYCTLCGAGRDFS